MANLCTGKSITYTGFRASVILQIDQSLMTCRFVNNTGTGSMLFVVGGGTTAKDGEVYIGYQAGAFISESPASPYPDSATTSVTIETAGHDVNNVPLPRIRFNLVIQDSGASVTVSISNATAF